MSDSFIPPPSPMTCDTFAPYVGDIYRVTLPDGTMAELTLISAKPIELKPFDGRALGKSGYVRRDPFVLLFRGVEAAVPRQGLYTFSHAAMGEFAMSVVPVGPGETGWQYESVFN